MNPETIKLVTDYLDKIGDKIGVGAETVWPWFVKKAFLSGVIATFTPLLFLVIAWTTTIIIRHKSDDSELRGGAIIIAILITFFATLILSVEGVPRLIVPEYHALSNLIDQIKP